LKDAIKKIQKVPDTSLVNRISEVLAKMDIDKDGAIRLDDVLKVSISWCSRNDVRHNDLTFSAQRLDILIHVSCDFS
jgi:hypothetical protein